MLFLLFSLLTAQAQTTADAQLFKEAKAHLLTTIDKRIEGLSKTKACVNAATDSKAIQVCHAGLKNDMSAMMKDKRAKNDSIRQKRRELRQKQREEARKKGP